MANFTKNTPCLHQPMILPVGVWTIKGVLYLSIDSGERKDPCE